MRNPVTWFEVNGTAPEQAAAFYSELFGWHTEAVPEGNYFLIDTHAGRGINGGIGTTREGQPAHAVFYVENPDIGALLAQAESLGAKTVVPVTEMEVVTFARFTDPFGNLIGLMKGDGTTNVGAGDNPPVDWFELVCAEPQRAWDFYRQLFGWQIDGGPASEGEGFVHGEVDTGGGIRGGIGSSPDGTAHSVVYASVDDLQKFLERAESIGGTTIMQPMQVDEYTSIALFADPQGSTFGMYSSQR